MSSDGQDPVLAIENLTVSFRDTSMMDELLPNAVRQRLGFDDQDAVHAVEDVSLDIGEEEVIALVGESGSGKTTLAKAAAALQEPSEGTIKYRGHDIQAVRQQRQIDDIGFRDIRKALQIVHQDPDAALNPYRTIMGSLEEPLRIWFPDLTAADRRSRILDLLDRIGVTPAEEFQHRYPHELSGGEKQRVALLRAMLVEPDVILADEPVSALDPSLKVEIMDLMLELKDVFRTSFVVISHNLEHARYMARKADGRIGIMYMGELVEIGSVEDVIEEPSHPYTKVLKWSTLPLHPEDATRMLDTEFPMREFDVPDPRNRPTGCRFHTRCPKARESCVTDNPDLLQVQDDGDHRNHRAACFRVDDTHEYWDADSLEADGEIDIPGQE